MGTDTAVVALNRENASTTAATLERPEVTNLAQEGVPDPDEARPVCSNPQCEQSHVIRNGKTKVLLKKVAARHVPADCIYRPKEGFSIPIKNWLKTRLRPVMENYLDYKRIEQEGIFRPEIIEQLKQAHLAGTANHSHVLWALVVFQDWQERWLKET